ncbi:MAG: Uma2 family endonuclease [Nostocaceae cyanobacterium]|nr:Uma2 family endonuclease [Nostocaceae cyanobacterium]
MSLSTSTQLSSNLSLAEFLKLPETKPTREYIDDKIYQKSMPQGKHSIIQTELPSAINQVGKSRKLALALTELRCTFAGRSLVPDISVFEWSRIPIDADGEIANRFESFPDWTIEILSPDQFPNRVTSSPTKSKIMVGASPNHFEDFLVVLLQDFATCLD